VGGGATLHIVVQINELLGCSRYSLGVNSSLMTITLPLIVLGFAGDAQRIFERGLGSEPPYSEFFLSYTT
jgi:hypothetical protein